jgi:hypothetical protein
VTRRFVDSIPEHDVLEQALEEIKPPYPANDDPRRLHFLLSTPFRYPPLKHGSRFGSIHQKGLWYGSFTEKTALAETAYYRFRFLADTAAELVLQADFTLFWATIGGERGVDLTSKHFERYRAEISNKSSYVDTQALGEQMREAGVTHFKYPSARDEGVNVGVFSSIAFRKTAVADGDCETWSGYGTRARLEFRKKTFSEMKRMVFLRSDFEVKGKLPIP